MNSVGRISARLMAALLLGTSLVVASAAPSFSQQAASSEVRSFNIAQQPLATALTLFGQQSGLQITADAAATVSVATGGVSGQMSVTDAMRQLLSGTGLSFSFDGPRTLVVSRATATSGQYDGSIVLGEVNVTAMMGGTSVGWDGSAEGVYRAPAAVEHISGEDVERFRGTSVGDFLSGTPGVINGDNRNGSALDVNIRGMQGQGRSPVIIDGASQETTVYRGYSGVAGRTYVDPDLIGEVQIEKGPSGAPDAAGAVGGVVRMNTITAKDILLPGKDFGVRIRGSVNGNSSGVPAVGTVGGFGLGVYGGTVYQTPPDIVSAEHGMDRPNPLFPTGGSGSVAVAGKTDMGELVVAVARRVNGNYHAGTTGNNLPSAKVVDFEYGGYLVEFGGLNRYRPGEEVLNTSFANTSVLVKGKLNLPGDQSLELSYMKYVSEYGEIMPSQVMWNGGTYQTWLNAVESDTVTATYKLNPTDNDLIDATVKLWGTSTDVVSHYQMYSTDPVPMEGLYNWWGSTVARVGVTAENTSRFDTALGDMKLQVGGTFLYEDATPALDYATLQRDGWRREVTAFANGEWQPTDWLTLNAGLRYNNFTSQDRSGRAGGSVTYHIINDNGTILRMTNQEYTAYWNAGGRGDYVRADVVTYYNDQPFNGDGLSPIVSATIEPIDGLQLYGRYAQTIRMPSLFENTQGWSFNIPLNYALEPEVARNIELGVNYTNTGIFTAGDMFGLKASYFNLDVDNYITRTWNPLRGQAPMVNLDRAKLTGFEVAASYDNGSFFGDVSWNHYLSTEYCVRPEDLQPNAAGALCLPGGVPNSYVINQVPPTDTVSLTLGTRLLEDKLTVGGRMTYVGERPVVGLGGNSLGLGGTIETANWKPYAVVDVFAKYEVNDNVKIDLSIDNIADVYYMDSLTLGLYPSPGRTFKAGITAKF